MSNGFSKLVGWEVWNFMTITHAKVEFDERNIVNFKGYNDSGKSAMLRALDVLLFNIKSAAQVGFIQDGTDYFRVVTYFDDGVVVLRDKYVNGQSLYEMYKGNDCLFTTRQGKTLSKVADVPQVIKDYLGVIKYDDLALNSRSCFEKQFLVQTTGSENYKFLNSILKSEELAVAATMINTDKNKLLSDISTTETELNTYKYQFFGVKEVTEELVSFLKAHDILLDIADSKAAHASAVLQLEAEISGITVMPEVEAVSFMQLELISGIVNTINYLNSLPDIPVIEAVDTTQLSILSKLVSILADLDNTPSIPLVQRVDPERFNALCTLSILCKEIEKQNLEISVQDSRLEAVDAEIHGVKTAMEEFGKRFKNCPVCNTLVEVGD